MREPRALCEACFESMAGSEPAADSVGMAEMVAKERDGERDARDDTVGFSEGSEDADAAVLLDAAALSIEVPEAVCELLPVTLRLIMKEDEVVNEAALALLECVALRRGDTEGTTVADPSFRPVREYLDDAEPHALTEEEADENTEDESERDAPGECDTELDALMVAPTIPSPTPVVTEAPLDSVDVTVEDSDADGVAVGVGLPDLYAERVFNGDRLERLDAESDDSLVKDGLILPQLLPEASPLDDALTRLLRDEEGHDETERLARGEREPLAVAVFVGMAVAAAVSDIVLDIRDVRLGEGDRDALRDALAENDASPLVELEPDTLRVALGDVLPLGEGLCERRPEPVREPVTDAVVDFDMPGDRVELADAVIPRAPVSVETWLGD